MTKDIITVEVHERHVVVILAECFGGDNGFIIPDVRENILDLREIFAVGECILDFNIILKFLPVEINL